MPDQSVASQDLIVSLGEIRNLVAARVAELALRRLRVLPLLSVAGRDLPELIGVRQDLHVGRVAQLPVVRRRPEVQLPGRHG